MFFLVVLCALSKALEASNSHLRASLVSGGKPVGPVLDSASVRPSPFENVINFVVHPYEHAIAFFERMERGSVRNFWGTVYITPPGRIHPQQTDQTSTEYPIIDCNSNKESLNKGDISYECVARFLRDYVFARVYCHSKSEGGFSNFYTF